MALMIGQQQEDEVRFKLCERCGKLMLIYERCECYNELLRASNRNKELAKRNWIWQAHRVSHKGNRNCVELVSFQTTKANLMEALRSRLLAWDFSEGIYLTSDMSGISSHYCIWLQSNSQVLWIVTGKVVSQLRSLKKGMNAESWWQLLRHRTSWKAYPNYVWELTVGQEKSMKIQTAFD